MSRIQLSLAFLFVFAVSSDAQRMQLELRPRVGDTLRMRLVQVTEMSGSRKGVVTKPVITTLRMFSRAIVESSAPTSSLILAVTDSVDVTTNDAHARQLADEAERQLEGRQMRLRLSPDGTIGVSDRTADVPKEVSELVAVMPASFPREPVAVGESWTREMPIPPSPGLGVPVGGVVRATFRLDSVSSTGDVAYVSMRGTLQQAPAAQASSDRALAGSVSGTMTVNRRRGWLSESRFLVQMRTTVVQRGAAASAPMQFRMTITQHMRVFDKR